MTVVELLIVTAIIAVMIALLVPAVQKAREAANRLGCSNNLKQLALACHGYHDQEESFPPGYRACTSTNPLNTSPGWGWAAFLLPYLEQGATAGTIIWHEPIEAPGNQLARLSELRTYLCPSDPAVPPFFSVVDSTGMTIAQAAPTSYAACYGSGELDEVPGSKEGVFYRNSAIRMSDITDGLSATILIGDRAWAHSMTPWAGAINNGTVRGGPANGARNNPGAVYPAPILCLFQANAINNVTDDDGSLDELFSFHPGGVNVLFGDGSVHFLSETINSNVLSALATRAGGEVSNPADY
jgi:prepilin-type processing-associated H-X9-DG protein